MQEGSLSSPESGTEKALKSFLEEKEGEKKRQLNTLRFKNSSTPPSPQRFLPSLEAEALALDPQDLKEEIQDGLFPEDCFDTVVIQS